MKYCVAVRKLESPGGSPLSWDTASLSLLTRNLGDLISRCGFDLSKIHNTSVLLHPNLVRPHRSRPASFTDPRIILAAVNLFKEAGAREVQVGENPGFGFPARQAFIEAGLMGALEDLDARICCFDEGEWTLVSNSQGRLYRSVLVAKPALDADIFVNIPKMKTHMLTQVSLCIKNLLGIIHDDQRILFHRNDIADKVVDLNMIRSPDLNIVDGLWAMEGQAPFHGTAIEEFNVVIAGTHAAAVDAVCCKIMGFDPREVPHVQLGLTRLLPEWDPESSLDNVGDSIESVSRHFVRPVISSLGQFRQVECIECGVCNGCLSAIRHSLDWLQAENGFGDHQPTTVISGRPMPNTATLETWEGRLILFGNCAAEFQFFDAFRRQNAIWVPGCPPHVLDLAKIFNKKPQKPHL